MWRTCSVAHSLLVPACRAKIKLDPYIPETSEIYIIKNDHYLLPYLLNESTDEVGTLPSLILQTQSTGGGGRERR